MTISLFFAFFLGSHILNNSCILASLSAGNLISIWLVSKTIPRKDRDADGPSGLSVARGTPHSAHKDTNLSTLHWHTVDADGPIVR